MVRRILFLLPLLIALLGVTVQSQVLKLPRESQAAVAKQTVGISTIEVNYSRPAVKDREIWGKLVPYGFEANQFGNGIPMPWRAGANENTTISFSHEVKINGKSLPAGTYGLHIIPDKDKDWVIIFSKDSRAWGSFFYEEKNDALRVTAKPAESPFQELLLYTFDNIKMNAAEVTLRWEKLKIAFTCEFETANLVMDDIHTQLSGAPGFNWANWNQAAFYCLTSGNNLEQGVMWCNKSIARNENSTNRNTLAYLLKAQKKTDEALKIFKENTEKFPTDWNVFDSYGEALADIGNKKDAINYFELALAKAPAGQKARIEKTIADLKK